MADSKKTLKKKYATFSDPSQVGECDSFLLVSGPPFDQREYMISPSESDSVIVNSKSSNSGKRRTLRPCDIKIDPKYVLDSEKALKKLSELIKDESPRNCITRLKNLICKFLQGTSTGFLIGHLPLVIEVLEYFSRNRSRAPEFDGFVKLILNFAKHPPKMGKSSDILQCKGILIDYFTLFGELLATFEDECFQLQLLEVVDNLITDRNLVDVSAVKLSFRHEAMEESQLPFVIATLMGTVSCNLYIYYLEIALQMILVSLKAGYAMIQNNILEFALCRLDPSSDPNGMPNNPADMQENEDKVNEYYRLLDKFGYLIWGLFSIISKYEIDVACPGYDALWSLRNVFVREAVKSTQKAFNTRNNLAGIMIELCAVFGERLPLMETGLAVDIAKLSVASEINMGNHYLGKLKFETRNEDFMLKQLMLLGCCLLARNENFIESLKAGNVIEGVLRLISRKSSVSWVFNQFETFLVYGLQTLSELVPVLPDVYLECKGNARFLSVMKWLVEEHLNHPFVLEALKTFCTLINSKNKSIIDDIKAQGGIQILFDLCFHLLKGDSLKMEHQNKLSKVLVGLERLLLNDRKLQNKFSDSCVSTSIKLLERILENSKNDSKWSPMLIISLGNFLWEGVCWCESSLKLFIEKGGIFLILDFIESRSFPLQMLFLGVLVDMTQEGETIMHLLTWRGKDGYGLLNMMTDIWREEEYFTKVHRTKYGVIQDVEMPLMTEEQWYLTHQVRDSHLYSPSIAEMVCSVRPKVHALYELLQRRYYDLTKAGESSYRLQFEMVKPAYWVYIPLIEHYFALKLGEVWFEVLRDANFSGVIPTAFDGQVLCSLIDEKIKWASRIKTMQEEILISRQGGDFFEEKNFFNFLKSCRLSSALEALRDLEYVGRTSFYRFNKKRKEIEESDEVNDFFDSTDIHRTFLYKPTTKYLCGDYMWVKSEKETVENLDEINPVSPPLSQDNRFEYLDDL